tara:strand:- start:321 stop:1244 length:924 start_codon:yes stop_codon:yes gene_type:complete
MNPVKSRDSIKKAYSLFGVRNFAVDSMEELIKIHAETNYANDLKIHLRIKVPNNFSKIKLSNKFGASIKEALIILKEINNISSQIGICFHVGSQCYHPSAFQIGLKKTYNVIKRSGVKVNFVNVGGGFPENICGKETPKLTDYFEEINQNFYKIFNGFSNDIQLFSEPGRSIVSDCLSLVVRVNLRKKEKLFISEGIHSYLNNAGYHNFTYPVRLFNRHVTKPKRIPFCFYGPTCDSNDFMKGPFFLPDSIKEGDWIEIKSMGAYTIPMKTSFNGFSKKSKIYLLKDEINEIHLEPLNFKQECLPPK